MKEAKEGEFDGVVVDAGVAFYFTVAAEFLNKPVWQAASTSQIAVKPVQEPVGGSWFCGATASRPRARLKQLLRWQRRRPEWTECCSSSGS